MDVNQSRNDARQFEDLKSGMSRYGMPLMVLALLALLGYFGWQWWQQHQLKQSAQLTGQYQQLLEKADQPGIKPTAGDGIIKQAPDSVQALQTQLLMARVAFDQKDYAKASQLLTQASQSKVSDEGLKSVARLHLAYTQMAQNQLDQALSTLNGITATGFEPTVNEARGDIYTLKQQPEQAKAAYRKAWDVLAQRQQPRELLQLKLADLGVIVETPVIDQPVNLPASPLATSAPAEADPAAAPTTGEPQS